MSIAGLLVDQRSLGASKRVSSVVLLPKPNATDPILNEPRVLARAEMVEAIDAARERIVFQRAATAFRS